MCLSGDVHVESGKKITYGLFTIYRNHVNPDGENTWLVQSLALNNIVNASILLGTKLRLSNY